MSSKPVPFGDDPLPETSGRQSGKGLKPGLNWADTGSVVHQVKGQVRFGRSKACTPTGAGKASNNLAAANSSKR